MAMEKPMALIDFVKNRQASQPQPVTEKPQELKPETPKIENLSAHVKAQAVEAAHPAAQLMDKATQHRNQAVNRESVPSDGREALMHNQSTQGKSQEALSPTDSGKGQTATQTRIQSRGRGMER
jgi:hypothetical protein